ncbi:MAG: hypothetical protein GF330_01490 [Candidatus Eisenbacteria bacterium]|nr:hypothetical protein [Candidatus Eisenbacteria bacterium]
MSPHLTDMQIALLVSERASSALRASLTQHLAECEQCSALLAFCARRERDFQAQRGELPAADGEAAAPAPPAAIFERLAAALGTSARDAAPPAQRRPGGPPRRVQLPLEKVTLKILEAFQATDPLPLAADGRPPEALPSLICTDQGLLVRFRHVPDCDAVRAHLVARPSNLPRNPTIVIPSLELSFPFEADGTALLRGIKPDDIRSRELRIEFDEPDQER